MFRTLLKHPAFLLKFSIYTLFICFSILFLFEKGLNAVSDNMRYLYSTLILLYGAYRMIRTWQDYQAELRDHEE